MTLDEILVAVGGLALIGFIYWFFLLKKTSAVRAGERIEITVSGGYSPEVISIPKGRLTELVFMRTDPNTCLEEVVLGDFKVRRQLPLNQPVSIKITPQQAGEFTYACGMNMYHGKIIVRET